MEYSCEVCKTAHATLHLTAVEGGRAFERHFCVPCATAAKLGPGSILPAANAGVPDWIRAQKQQLLCPACSHLNQDGWKFCSACGAPRSS